MIAKLLIIAVLTSISLSIVGCNTVEGAGKDTERAGQKMQDSANEHR